jgi:hypothetical protein
MKRWLVPVAAAAAVLMLLGGLWWFAGPGSRGGDTSFAGGDTGTSDSVTSDTGSSVDPDTPVSSDGGVPSSRGTDQPGQGEPGFPGSGDPLLDPPTDDPLPADPLPDVGPKAVIVDSYQVRDDGRGLTVRYTIGVPECYGTIAEPQVEETPAAVTITLTRIPPRNLGDVACIDIALLKTVEIRLESDLGDRAVLDGSTGQRVRR